MILFDFDGTLADTISLAISLINDHAEKFKYRKLDSTQNGDLSARKLVKECGIPFWKLPYLVSFFRKKLGEHSAEIHAVSGLKELLEGLKASGQQLGILTSNSAETVSDFLKKNELEAYFSFIRTGVPVFGKKGAIRKARRQLKQDFVYVGDEIRDVEACRKTGTPVVSVAWGFNSAESLEGVNPGLVAKTADEALSLIRKLAVPTDGTGKA